MQADGVLLKISLLTFQYLKYEICKGECAGKDSHYHVRQEHG